MVESVDGATEAETADPGVTVEIGSSAVLRGASILYWYRRWGDRSPKTRSTVGQPRSSDPPAATEQSGQGLPVYLVTV